MDIKFKVIEVFPQVRGMDVHFYTDDFPEGTVLHVTVYPDPMPTGQDLEDYILLYAPAAWLEVKSKCAKALPDMAPVAALKDREVRGNPAEALERAKARTSLKVEVI